MPAICIQKRQTVLFWISPKKCPADNCRNDDSGCCVNRGKLILICTNYDYLTSFDTTWSQAKKMKKLLNFFLMLIFREIAPYIMMIKKEAQLFLFSTQSGGRERAKTFFIHKAKGTKLKKRTNKGKLIFLTSFVFPSLVCVSWIEYDASWNQIALRKMVQPPNPSVVVSKSQWKDKLLLWGNQPKVFPI